MLKILFYIFPSFLVGFLDVLPDGFKLGNCQIGKQPIDSTIQPIEILRKSLNDPIDNISFEVIVVLCSWSDSKDKSFSLFGWEIRHFNGELFHLDKFLSLHTVDHGFELVVDEGWIFRLNRGKWVHIIFYSFLHLIEGEGGFVPDAISFWEGIELYSW